MPPQLEAKQYYGFKSATHLSLVPAYAAGWPPSHIESLTQKAEISFDASKLQAKEDWVGAGKLALESDVLSRRGPGEGTSIQPVFPPSSDGILPFFTSR